MIDVKEVRSVCRRCGRDAPAEKFVLDHFYKLVVCPTCAREHDGGVNTAEAAGKAAKLPSKQPGTLGAKPAGMARPAGQLDRQARPMERNIPKPGHESKIKLQCHKCRFKFNFNKERRAPRICPYCGTPVPEIR
ncbi:MAG: hypothetical protein KJ709_03815 [Nanoarchaeota archaeon]|nr:hypothetical protein [Nanoarchaeota archaeon]